MANANTKTKVRNLPTKETINLAMKEKSQFSPLKIIPAVFLIVVLASLFSRFAVVEFYLRLADLQAQYGALSTQMEQYIAATADYDDVLNEYTHRSNKWMSDEELMLIDYRELYPMIESCVLPHSNVASISLQGNSMSMNLTELSLNDASAIISALSAREDVVSVSINTANRSGTALTEEKTGTATFVVELTNGLEIKPAVTEADLAALQGGE